MSQRGARKTWSNRKTSMCWTNIGSIGSKLGSIRGFAGSARGLSLPCQGSIGGPFIRSLLVTKIGEPTWTALQIETWCQYPINLIDCFEVRFKSVRSQTIFGRVIVKILESWFEKLSKFGELIWTALQIETWCHLQSLLLGLMRVCKKSVGSQSAVSQEYVRSLSPSEDCQMSDSNQIWRADVSMSVNRLSESIGSQSGFCEDYF